MIYCLITKSFKPIGDLRHLHPNNGVTRCVVDPQDWLQGWSSKFDALNIGFLRSPTIAHPDMFDSTALLAYAQMQERHRDELIESGCTEMTKLLSQGGQSQTQSGLWTLPSTQLFQDFCLDLVKSLPHDFIHSTVSDIDDNGVQSLDNDDGDGEEKDDNQSPFRVHLASGQTIIANSVVLALGTVGKPIVPGFLSSTNVNAKINILPLRVLCSGTTHCLRTWLSVRAKSKVYW